MSSLTWSTAHKYGANSLAHQFPSFQIDAAQAAKGNVRVEARSPSGHVQEMSVSDTNGVYTTNFTPTEVGDWMISILYEGQHIHGSPFNVRVYDAAQVKVFGLEGGAVGKTFSFSADCTAAGDGELSVDITHNGRSVPSHISSDRSQPGIYRVNFTPMGSGVYTIRVYYAGMEVTGSPYTLEIVDSSMVKASGEGLSMLEVNKRAAFIVNTNGAPDGDVTVNITGPSGRAVPSQVYNQHDGTFRVEYNPTEVGDYLVEINYYNKPIAGSPFRVYASNRSLIELKNLNQFTSVGRIVEFDIDAQYAGSGNLEIMVNDGTIPCSVQNRGNRQFHATFTPKEPIPHYIEMKFNGREVPGSPWRVEVKQPVQVTASGLGLQLIPVRHPAIFEVRVGGGGLPDGNLDAKISSPSGRPVHAQVTNNRNGTFRVDYTPHEVGNHTVELSYDGNAVQGSPFTAKVYDTSAITVSNINAGMVHKPVEFNIDVTQAGEGQLEIMVNRGSVPNTVRMLRKGVFSVSFVPTNPQSHAVDIKFNGELLPTCPINVPIMDTSRVTVQGDGLHQVAVNKFSSFRVNTASAGDADLKVRVTSPSGQVTPAQITGSPSGGYDVSYTLNEVGTHRVDVDYADTPVPGSPFYVKAYQANKVRVSGVENGVVGRKSNFQVDVNEAGEGNLEISIVANGRNLQNYARQVGPGLFEVSYTPMEGVDHEALVTFNGDHVSGSPFQFRVTDAGKVSATGDGLSMIAAQKPATFTISAPGATRDDLDIKITGPSSRPVRMEVTDHRNGQFDVNYIPTEIGDHVLQVSYMDVPIQGSPFIAKTWDAKQVVVTDINNGVLHQPYTFNIDASRAGSGNLEIIVSASGENVPNFVTSKANSQFQVTFTPEVPDTHSISVKFNKEPVVGSPFLCSVVDGTKATAHGSGLDTATVKNFANFSVQTNGAGEAELDVVILSPSGSHVPSRITGNARKGFDVEYTPQEIGQHRINIEYADVPITGSPFFPQCNNPGAVHVGHIPDGIVGDAIHFDVDCSKAGEGTLTVDVKGRHQTAYPEIVPKGNSIFDVKFVPMEASPHSIKVTFNNEEIPGSPFICDVHDISNVNVYMDSLQNIPVSLPARFEVDPGGGPASDSDLEVTVTDPHGRHVPVHITRNGKKYAPEFIPATAGPYQVHISFHERPVQGSPFQVFAFDHKRVRIIDVSPPGKIGEEVGFTVDTSDAGQGEIDVEVVCNNQMIPARHERISMHHNRFHFKPTVAVDHVVDVNFCSHRVQGCPLVMKVNDFSSTLTLQRREKETFGVNTQATSIIETHGNGKSLKVDDFKAKIEAPNGDMVPARIVLQPDGDYKVEYSSKYTGRHTVEILYAGQPIMGSPFFVEIYDPNKIRVEGMKTGGVGEIIGFDVIRHEAGKAEMNLRIVSPSGNNVSYDMQTNAQGESVTYTPYEAGPHHIYITYGGLEVPGCPMAQMIEDSANVTAFGDGLYKGEEDKPTQFFVDAGGKRGDLSVEVDGPNSIAKVVIDTDSSGRQVVTYIPVEVGNYNVRVKWNNREIAGSPFSPKVVAANKVEIDGGWQSVLNANGEMELFINEAKVINLHTRRAGPGTLSAECHGPAGAVPVDVQHMPPHSYSLSFTPRQEGEYTLYIRWNDIPLQNIPIIGVAGGRGPPINHEKVILTGRGLKEARMREEAEFVIDATEAGPGTPDVKLTGVNDEIYVTVREIGMGKYHCSYTPSHAGAYLLHINWSDRAVRGSPFKVDVTAPSDPSKVSCTGEGLKMGIMGKEIKSIIDTRRAGPGELTAHCMGPTKVAYCELFDHRDGTFTLNVRPQEAGKHDLQIKYGGEHVPGSPFTLRVSGAPDASKVRVYGPGIEAGILATYQSRFITETRGAGAGQLTVRIRGPKGAFRVEMQRDSQKDRTILCRYDPTEVGDYIIHVKWSGEHVPGSPFHVQIFDTESQLEKHRRTNPSGSMLASDWDDY